MAGTSEKSYWEQDGMYLTQTAYGTVTLGDVVELGTTESTVVTGTSLSTQAIGVAIAGYRASRTSTDNVVASGGYVTVATRGVVNLTAYGTVTRGQLVFAGGASLVISGTTVADTTKVLGIALTTAASAATVKVKLMRG